MLRFVRESVINGDVFNASERYKLVTINTVGAMGRGIALDCKIRYPELYLAYRAICKAGLVYPDDVTVHPEQNVILFATKLDWKAASTVDIIRRSAIGLHRAIKKHGITEIAMPPLGMSNGWLKKWQRVEIFKIIEALGRKNNCTITMYLPDNLYEEVYALYH